MKFGWEAVCNQAALPVADSVLYPFNTRGQTDNHGLRFGDQIIKLETVGESLVAALGSINVVCSSLALCGQNTGNVLRKRKEKET